MKLTNKWLLALLPVGMLSSCADDVFDNYTIPEPANLAETKYLEEYKVLKDYNSGINLGAEVNASEYSGKRLVYGLASTNFNEVSAGKSLTHAELVKNTGVVNSAVISDFVKSAQAAGQNVFGSTLFSNSNLNTTYLSTKGILAAHPDPNAKGGTLTELKWVEQVVNGDCEGESNEALFWTVAQKGPIKSVLNTMAKIDRYAAGTKSSRFGKIAIPLLKAATFVCASIGGYAIGSEIADKINEARGVKTHALAKNNNPASNIAKKDNIMKENIIEKDFEQQPLEYIS